MQSSSIVPLYDAKLEEFDRKQKIGKGTFGLVYQVQHIHTGQIFAEKRVLKTGRSPLDMELLMNEKYILENFKNIFLTELFYFFESEKKAYFIMEYLPGGTLLQKLQEVGPFDPKTTKFYAGETFLALEFLHGNGIIHRDIKPENILLDGRGHVKLGDFGVSKYLEKGAKTKTFCGTLVFQAPEIIFRVPYSFEADLYSFGILIFECLFAYVPFRGEDVSDQRGLFRNSNFGNSNFKFPRPFGMTMDIEALLSNLITYDPQRRFSIFEIKNSEFFQWIDWEKMAARSYEPPKDGKFRGKSEIFEEEIKEENNNYIAGFDMAQEENSNEDFMMKWRQRRRAQA